MRMSEESRGGENELNDSNPNSSIVAIVPEQSFLVQANQSLTLALSEDLARYAATLMPVTELSPIFIAYSHFRPDLAG
jgi:hypothetical protein